MKSIIYPKRSHFIISVSLGFTPPPALATMHNGQTRLLQAAPPSDAFMQREIFKVN